TDVMIATYKYDNNNQCTLTPIPLFWESFYTAGDDLLKEVIHHYVIEGEYAPIEQKLKNLGKKPIDYLQQFIGKNTGIAFQNRQMRSSFNLQVSVPLATYFLELLKQGDIEQEVFTFNEIFDKNRPTEAVLNHFKEHFGFELESLKWRYDRKVMANIIEKTF